MTREHLKFDVVIVGAGPAGLSAAIKLAQLSPQLTICVLEKGAEVGAHILSGAVLDPKALHELLPDWQQRNPPTMTPVIQDRFFYLSKHKAWPLPVPFVMRNKGNFIIRLGTFCRWLAEQAETLGVNIFPGFAAAEILYEQDQVIGVRTGDKGIDKNGRPLPSYQPGIELYAKQTFFAEGCRGSLTEALISHFDLRQQSCPQTYALGFKELWEVPQNLHKLGQVAHTVGWPLSSNTYGGSFIYHLENNLLAIGLVIGLDYTNPYLNLYEEFQRFKTHPMLRPLLAQSKRIAYGARALNEGGLQSIPQLVFPGGLILGCAAGLVNVPKIKGIHNAMKSGMVAAESVLPILNKQSSTICVTYPEKFKRSWAWKELYRARNIRPAFCWGLWPGLLYAAFDMGILRGRAPWTFRHKKPDHVQLKEAKDCRKIVYEKHDNQVTFDLLDSVYLTQSSYQENQPCHLKLINETVPIDVNLKYYAAPEQRYCPAGVYEILINESCQPYLQINKANCIHCKACDIKDENIIWVTPEGGSGPRYWGM